MTDAERERGRALRAWVQREGAKYAPADFMALALERVLSTLPPKDWMGGRVLIEVGRLQAEGAVALKESRARSLTAKDLIRHYTGEIEGGRQWLFERTAPPFATEEAAVTWLERKAAEEGEGRREGDGPAIDELQRDLENLSGREVVLRVRSLSYWHGAESRQLRVWPGTMLWDLAKRVEQIERETGFRAPDVLLWLLVGREPSLPGALLVYRSTPRASVWAWAPGLPDRREWVEIVLNTRDLSFEDLHAIYRAVRRKIGLAGRKHDLTPLQVRVYELAQEIGGPPDKGKATFWQEVRARLVKEGWAPVHWYTLQRHYKKAVERLKGPA